MRGVGKILQMTPDLPWYGYHGMATMVWLPWFAAHLTTLDTHMQAGSSDIQAEEGGEHSGVALKLRLG